MDGQKSGKGRVLINFIKLLLCMPSLSFFVIVVEYEIALITSSMGPILL